MNERIGARIHNAMSFQVNGSDSTCMNFLLISSCSVLYNDFYVRNSRRLVLHKCTVDVDIDYENLWKIFLKIYYSA